MCGGWQLDQELRCDLAIAVCRMSAVRLQHADNLSRLRE